MKVYKDIELCEFEAWQGAKTAVKIIHHAGKDKEFEQMIDELYPDGLSSTELNDLLWFDTEWIYEQLGIEEEAEWQKIIRGE